MSYLLLLVIISVLFIVTSHRFPIEKRLAARFRIDRDWWIPVVSLFIAICFSLVPLNIISTVFFEKIDIIVLIFSFGVLSEGLSESGFFTFLSYKVADYANGDTFRLVAYIFILTSAATYFTSNDIVILVLTPIIVEICFQSRIQNMKLLLLSQFIAANTLSMGLLIGSPTNIIISEKLNIDFFTYLILMSAPALIAFLTSFSLVLFISRYSRKIPLPFFQSLTIPETYTIPDENPEPEFTNHMRDWVGLFCVFLVLVAIVTYLQLSLLYCAVPSILIASMYWLLSENHSHIKAPFKNLPYGVFFFGLAFFIFADVLAKTPLVTQYIIPFVQSNIQSNPRITPIIGIFGSGLFVNIVNDLPASAIIAEILPQLQFQTTAIKTVFTQSILIGLNIGTYVTQIGALAGLIWFSQLRLYKKKYIDKTPQNDRQITLPTRTDLIKYGLLHFIFVGTTLSIFLILELLFL